MSRKIITKSENETLELGRRIGERACPGDVIALYGDLGAGKTLLVKGIAKGLDIDEMITSPTFTILQEYEDGRMPLYHLDVYRIDDPDSMEEIGYFDFVDGRGLTVIEWAGQIEEVLPKRTMRITVLRQDGGNAPGPGGVGDPAGVPDDNTRYFIFEGENTDF